jgi:hypothetical protein
METIPIVERHNIIDATTRCGTTKLVNGKKKARTTNLEISA